MYCVHEVITMISIAALAFATGSIAHADEQSQSSPPAAGVSDGVQVKEIKKLSPIALVVLDKNCPDIVQPYKLTDNAASLAVFSAKEGAKDLIKRGLDLLPGRTAAPAKKGELSDSTRLAAKQLNWLPMNAEVRYGEESHKSETNVLDRQSKLGQKHYPIADSILTEILSNVQEKHEYNFQLFILKNSTRNAMARPGGLLYLDQGLVDNPAQRPKAYFALAHEIAHVLQRHETKELQGMIVDSIHTKDDLMNVMRNVKTDPAVLLAHVKTSKDTFSQHHADQELQSDSCAARVLSRVFPDRLELGNTLDAFLKDLPPPEPVTPRPAPRSDADKLTTIGHDIVNTPLKRHPSTHERSTNLRRMYDEIVKAEP